MSKTPEELTSEPSKTLHIAKPLGHVNIPALVCGIVGGALAGALSLMNRYDSIIESVKSTYSSKPFYLENVDQWHPTWDLLLSILIAIAIAYVVLDSAGKGKRILIGVISLTLISMFSPLLMLWGVFWFPITVLVGVALAWIFAFVYSNLHVMPCELGMRMKKKKSEKKYKNKHKKMHKKRSTLFRKSRLFKKFKKTDRPEVESEASFQPIDNNQNSDV